MHIESIAPDRYARFVPEAQMPPNYVCDNWTIELLKANGATHFRFSASENEFRFQPPTSTCDWEQFLCRVGEMTPEVYVDLDKLKRHISFSRTGIAAYRLIDAICLGSYYPEGLDQHVQQEKNWETLVSETIVDFDGVRMILKLAYPHQPGRLLGRYHMKFSSIHGTMARALGNCKVTSIDDERRHRQRRKARRQHF